MKRNVTYKSFAISLVLIVLLSSCSSHVRFASKKHDSPSTKKNTSNTKSVSKSGSQAAFGQLNFPKGNDDSQMGDLIVSEAFSWLGTPYRYGGDDRSGVDCSGLVSQVYGALGISVPRTSRTQFENSERVKTDKLQQGDLIFFSNGAIVNHVGIYIGNGEMIHASSSRGVIKQAVSDEYYTRRFAGVGRVIK
jgi:cell wall-associated NlpC family hydrolase